VAMFFLVLTMGLVTPSLAKTSWAQKAEEATGPLIEYFEMHPLVLPLLNERGLAQQVSLVISLEMNDGHLATELSLYEPRLADAYIQDLYGVLGAGYGMINGNILDVRVLKQRLTAITQEVLGPELVNDVLLQVVQQRPL